MITLRIFITLLFSATAAASAQNRITDTTATCIAYWNNNESRIYQIKRSKVKYDAGTVKSSSGASYEAHIKITDSTAYGFTIEWIYRNFKAEGTGEHALNSLNAIMEGMIIRYKTDELGSFAELINWKEVRDFAIQKYESIAKQPSQQKEFVAALDQVKSIFQSKENIETAMIKEIQLYHTPYGVEYNLSEQSQVTALPNITGGKAIPATISYKIIKLDPPNDFCKVYQNQTIDKGAAGPIIADMLKKLSGGKLQNEADIKKEIANLEISDINEFSYSISTG